MKHHAFTLMTSVAALLISNPVGAGSKIICPDISQARQIAECPTEDDVKRMFKTGCGFERNPKATTPELCDTYAEFRHRKYTTLWESSDGKFMGYVTCAVRPAEIKMAKPASVAVSQENGLYKISCEYQGGLVFTLRTRSVCRVPGVKNSMVDMRANCGPDTATCSAECD